MTKDQRPSILTHDPNMTYPPMIKTRERLRSLTGLSERLVILERLSLQIEKIESQSETLLSLFESMIGDLTYVSDCLERESQKTEDPEVWTETEDLINFLDFETRDLRQSLSDLVSTLRDPLKSDRLSFLLSETADHMIMSKLLEDPETDPESGLSVYARYFLKDPETDPETR